MFASKASSSLTNSRNSKAKSSSIALSAILIGALLLLSGKPASAQVAIVPIGHVMDGCEIDWYWEGRGQLSARVDSQIIITNVTDTHIEGKITSKNSNYTLTMYDDESIIRAQFGYNSDEKGDWYNAARPSNGVFSIEIPAEYSDADYVKLVVNGNSFVMQPPDEVQVEDEASEEPTIENSTSTVMNSNSTIITTNITTTTSTNSTTNSTMIATTKIITIEPVNATESTNSTTTIITTVTTTTISPTDTITTTTTDTRIVNSTSADEEETEEEEEISYVIGGNIVLDNIIIEELPQSIEYWLADNVTMFFEEGYFMLDKTPVILYPYEDYEDFEENKKATRYEHYQTQINVEVNGAMIKHDFT